MTTTIFKENKKRLEQEKARIELRLKLLSNPGETSATGTDSPAWTDYGQKTDENAAEVAEYADNVSVQNSLHDRLDQVTNALDAIEKGTYGVCKECGNPIEEARLKVMPTALRCLSCKRKNS